MFNIEHVVEYQIGDIVYFKLNPEKKGMITGIKFRPNGCVIYDVTWDNMDEKCHYSLELTKTKEFVVNE